MDSSILSAASNAASSNVQGIMGAAQMYYAMKELKALKKMGVPKYGLSPELKNDVVQANEMAKRGYTPEQKAAAFQDANRQTNLSYQRGLGNAGNTLGGSITAASNANALSFLNNYYAKDASVMAANIRYAHSMNREVQRINDMNTQQQINIYQQDKNAAAGLLNSGLYNTTSAIQGHLGATSSVPTEGWRENRTSQASKDMVSFNPNQNELWNDNMGDLM